MIVKQRENSICSS